MKLTTVRYKDGFVKKLICKKGYGYKGTERLSSIILGDRMVVGFITTYAISANKTDCYN